ncbi:winged helix-turn-helix domain-containing protein [Enterobacter mori]
MFDDWRQIKRHAKIFFRRFLLTPYSILQLNTSDSVTAKVNPIINLSGEKSVNKAVMSETDLMNIKSVNFDKILYVDCYYNKASLPELNIAFSINESQKRLMLCLLRDISSKHEIMQVVWNDSHLRQRDNNYHQLVFQMRALLQRNGLPSELIMTIPHYGLKLNAPLLQSLIDCRASAADLTAVKRTEKKRMTPFLRGR